VQHASSVLFVAVSCATASVLRVLLGFGISGILASSYIDVLNMADGARWAVAYPSLRVKELIVATPLLLRLFVYRWGRVILGLLFVGLAAVIAVEMVQEKQYHTVHGTPSTVGVYHDKDTGKYDYNVVVLQGDATEYRFNPTYFTQPVTVEQFEKAQALNLWYTQGPISGTWIKAVQFKDAKGKVSPQYITTSYTNPDPARDLIPAEILGGIALLFFLSALVLPSGGSRNDSTMTAAQMIEMGEYADPEYGQRAGGQVPYSQYEQAPGRYVPGGYSQTPQTWQPGMYNPPPGYNQPRDSTAQEPPWASPQDRWPDAWQSGGRWPPRQ
jgi:hypothetical protein